MGKKKTGSAVRPNDYELLYYGLQNQESAWNLLHCSYQSLIEIALYRWNAYFTEEERKELKQECFHSLSLALYEYREDQGASFYTYVSKRLENVIVSYVRRRQALKRKAMVHAYSLDVSINEKESCYWIDQIRNDQWEFEGVLKLRWKEAQKQEEAILRTCSELEQKIFRYHRYGYRYDEIAAILHTNKKKVDNTIQKIRKKL